MNVCGRTHNEESMCRRLLFRSAVPTATLQPTNDNNTLLQPLPPMDWHNGPPVVEAFDVDAAVRHHCVHSFSWHGSEAVDLAAGPAGLRLREDQGLAVWRRATAARRRRRIRPEREREGVGLLKSSEGSVLTCRPSHVHEDRTGILIFLSPLPARAGRTPHLQEDSLLPLRCHRVPLSSSTILFPVSEPLQGTEWRRSWVVWEISVLWLHPSKQLVHSEDFEAYRSPSIIHYNLVAAMMKVLATYSRRTMYVWCAV